jgi:hypothetical protein
MRKLIVLTALVLCCASVDAKAADTALETALEVQSWCKQIVTAKIAADSRLFFKLSHDTGFCWGAIGAIQDLARINTDDGTPMIGICAPSESTRLQMIKIFL